jgi:hypothetical protein
MLRICIVAFCILAHFVFFMASEIIIFLKIDNFLVTFYGYKYFNLQAAILLSFTNWLRIYLVQNFILVDPQYIIGFPQTYNMHACLTISEGFSAGLASSFDPWRRPNSCIFD